MASPRRSAKQKTVSAELADATDVVLPSVMTDSHRDYLRERILTVGSSMLADIDILEFLLLAMSRPQPQQLAQALLARFDSFPRVIAAPVWDLLAVEGLGIDGVAVLKSIQLAALRLTRAEVMNKPVLGRWDRLMVYLHAELSRERVEQFRVLFLNNRGRVLADEVLQHGTVDHVRIEPRQVAERALELSATALILVHNRTSGDPTPTEDDFAMNEQIRTTAAVLSIELLDHIVMGDGCWFSFREKGLLDRSSAFVGTETERAMPFLGYCHERRDAVVRANPKVGAAAPRARFQRSVHRK
jgi:DNA repair protein RadC